MKAWMVPAAAGVMLALVAAAPVDWTKKVSQTPAGAYVLGNPAAAKKLVEYASYTCSHCAHFSRDSAAPLRQSVASGKVSVEFRHALRDRVDLTAALLARCAGPAKFFAASEAIFAAQDDWMAKAEAYEAANGEAVTKAGPSEGSKMIARGSGLIALAARFGVTEAKADQCLTDKAQQDLLIAQSTEAWGQRQIPGTPYFLINGSDAQANSWATLQPRLTN